MYPKILDNPQYTSVINQRHYQRLNGYLAEANERGQKIITINPANEDFSKQQGTMKIPPTLIPEPIEDLRLMEEELFGPLLPIRTYRKFEETITYINSKPRPLAAYYFLRARDARGRVFDSVARFHLGNGARLEQLDFLGDVSEKGMQQGFGLMVNYLYDLDEIESNHEAFVEKGTVAAAPAVRRLLKTKAVGVAAG